MTLLGGLVAAFFMSSSVMAAEPEAGVPLIKEPFYAVLVELSAGDSLGVWSGKEIARRVEATGRPTHFPLDWIEQVQRREAAGIERQQHRACEVRRIWDILLKRPVDRPLPYSILGYHPGSLRVAQHLIVSEWAVGDLSLRYMQDDEATQSTLSDVRVLRLDAGWIVLDVDGLLDALLGSKLDDSWTLALVLAWQEELPLAVAVSVGRDGRRIFGEMDLPNDKVLPHGHPLTAALSRAARRWTLPPPGGGQPVWQEE